MHFIQLPMLCYTTSNYLFAQQYHNLNIVKQQQNTNGILRANNIANTNAKIHANSNSVFGTNNSSANYNKKNQPKKEEGKSEEETKRNNKVKKQKK